MTVENIDSPRRAEGSGSRTCWSCDGDVDLRAAFCHLCGIIQPPLVADHFSRLGLQRKYDLKVDDLERQYFGFQRSFHPDRFAGKSPREQAISMEYAANINDAYETLRDPLLRAEYLLKLQGHKVAGSNGETVDEPGLLLEVMELSEVISGAETLDQLFPLMERANAEVAASELALGVVFADNDFDRAATIALRLRYMIKLADDAQQRAASLEGS